MRPAGLGVGPLSVPEDPGIRPPGSTFSGLTPVSQIPRYQVLVDERSGTRVPALTILGLCFIEFEISGVQAPARTGVQGSFPRLSNIGFIFFFVHLHGAQTPQSEIRDSATVDFELGEDWTARSGQVVTPSPPGEASRARPSERATTEEEVARGKVSLPLSLLGRAAGGPQAEAEALGHHSDPYQARPHSQGPQGPPCQLGAGPGA